MTAQNMTTTKTIKEAHGFLAAELFELDLQRQRHLAVLNAARDQINTEAREKLEPHKERFYSATAPLAKRALEIYAAFGVPKNAQNVKLDLQEKQITFTMPPEGIIKGLKAVKPPTKKKPAPRKAGRKAGTNGAK